VDADAVGPADLFAAHAAIALGHATEVDPLHQALRTRTTFGAALGLLMQQYTVTQNDAFGLMVQVSSHSNVKIRDLAARMVQEARDRGCRSCQPSTERSAEALS
jgi:hypothetical protein